jgi:hypothetical protein
MENTLKNFPIEISFSPVPAFPKVAYRAFFEARKHGILYYFIRIVALFVFFATQNLETGISP